MGEIWKDCCDIKPHSDANMHCLSERKLEAFDVLAAAARHGLTFDQLTSSLVFHRKRDCDKHVKQHGM